MSAARSWIGIDWGGTRIKWGVVEDDGNVRLSRVVGYDPSRSAAQTLETLAASIEASLDAPVSGIGLSLTSVVAPDTGVVLLPGKVRDLEGLPIVERLKARFGCPVVADNDGRAAMRAERRFGAARDVEWCVTLTIGTGIGSGVLIDGRIPVNPHLQFGTQMGHLTMMGPTDQRCLTGGEGTGEMACSATALVLDVSAGIVRGQPSSLSEAYFRDPLGLSFEKILSDGVRKGDPLSTSLFERWVGRLGRLVTNAIHAYGPQKVILSGGATKAADLFLERLQSDVDSRVYIYPKGTSVPIVISDLPDLAGVLGAAAHIMETRRD